MVIYFYYFTIVILILPCSQIPILHTINSYLSPGNISFVKAFKITFFSAIIGAIETTLPANDGTKGTYLMKFLTQRLSPLVISAQIIIRVRNNFDRDLDKFLCKSLIDSINK